MSPGWAGVQGAGGSLGSLGRRSGGQGKVVRRRCQAYGVALSVLRESQATRLTSLISRLKPSVWALASPLWSQVPLVRREGTPQNVRVPEPE